MVGRNTSGDDAAVGFFDPLVITPALAVCEIEIADGEVELILSFLVKVPLVAFEGEDVVAGWRYVCLALGETFSGRRRVSHVLDARLEA